MGLRVGVGVGSGWEGVKGAGGEGWNHGGVRGACRGRRSGVIGAGVGSGWEGAMGG